MEAIDLCEEEEEGACLGSKSEDAVWIIDDDEAEQSGPPPRQRAPSAADPTTHMATSQQASGLYVLDCGCQGDFEDLSSRTQEQAGQLQKILRPTTAVGASALAQAVGCLACSTCGHLLSAQDAWKLLGPSATSQAYSALASSVKQVVQAHEPAGFEAAQDTSAPAAAAAVSACEQLWQELSALQALLLGGDPASAAASGAAQQGRRARRGKAAAQPKQPARHKAYRGSGGHGAWAAGTGYGGNDGMTKQAQAAMTAAAQRQAAVDTAMVGHLQAITAILKDPLDTAAAALTPAGPSSSNGSRKRVRGGDGVGGRRVMMGLPWPLCGVVLCGPLAWLLRLLFQNDSLMDVVKRLELYSAGMELLKLVGATADLLPLLQLPADDPRDSSTPTPVNTATSTAAGQTSSSSSTTLLTVLRRLEQQAKLYRRSAEQLMAEEEEGDGDDEDTTAAVCLALDLSSLVQELEEAAQLFSSIMQDKGCLQVKPLSAAADPPPGAAAAGQQANSTGGSSKGRRSRGTAAADGLSAQPAATAGTQSPEAAAAVARKRCYVSAMQPYQFIEADLLSGGHYFAHDAEAAAKVSGGGEMMRKRLKRITEELGALSTSLPLSWDSSILLAVHADRLDVLRALLLPHPETPYGGGAFLFDILLPPEYPDKPPKVQFLTTGSGRWRANPNLYACGKVCLSLLGTWSGPSWQPGVSTLLQVLVSLQSMVFVPDPYFNEPGYERSGSTAAGKQASASYNAGIRLGTASHALLPALQHPDAVFKDALRVHYMHQAPRVRELLQQWLHEVTPNGKQQLQQVVKLVEKELDKLPSTAAEQQQQQQQRRRRQHAPETGRDEQQQEVQHRRLTATEEVDVVDLT